MGLLLVAWPRLNVLTPLTRKDLSLKDGLMLLEDTQVHEESLWKTK